MDTLLLSIPPNALETLILESISVDDVLNSEHIESHLLLGKNWKILQTLLQGSFKSGTSLLALSVQAEHHLAERQKQLTEVRYNTAVRVVEVQEALAKLDIEDFKKHMQTNCLKRLEQEHGIQTESIELQFAELSLVFAQLRNFYEHAAKHTYAVISVTSDNLVPTSHLTAVASTPDHAIAQTSDQLGAYSRFVQSQTFHAKQLKPDWRGQSLQP